MDVGGHLFLVDTVAKMHRYLRVAGWFHHPDSKLTAVSFSGFTIETTQGVVGIDHGGVLPSLGKGKGFRIDGLLADESFPVDGCVRFETSAGEVLTIKLTDLVSDRRSREVGGGLYKQFRDAVASKPDCRLLEVGGRDRSEVGHRREFPTAQSTVIDILDGPGVDVVGDAHAMGNIFDPQTFDFVHSRSVFEHLLMPWKAVVEINRVLKPGGLVYVSTHQTIGLHDQPWDFLRFSKDAWPGFFNAKTGFEILGVFEEHPQYVIPWIWTEDKTFAEGSVGFEASGVLARKTGPARLTWPVQVKEITGTLYPDIPDGNRS